MTHFPVSQAADARNWLAAIVNSSDDVIISKSLEGVIQSWNRAAEQLFGYTAEEAIGHHIGLIIPPDRLDEEHIILGKVRAGESIGHFETIRRRKDGSLLDVSLTVSPIRDDQGVIVGVSKIGKDITEAKHAQRAAAHLAAIVDSSEDAIVSKNLDGIITSWNHGAEIVFGHTADEAIGRHITLIIPPQYYSEEAVIIGKVRAGDRLEHFETTRMTKSGDLIDVSLTVSPVRDTSGTIIGASKIARDVTEQKKTQRLLAEANRRRDEFMANMSHELRTPMNAIIGLAHIVSLSDALKPKEQKALGLLRDSADSLLALINDVLDFAKIDQGDIEVEHTEFHLTDSVARVVQLLSVKAQEKALDIKLDVQPEVGDYWMGDDLRLQQVLTNLLGNAIKFTDQGHIDVKLQIAPTDGIIIEVADTGIGIALEKLDLVFEKFTQADNSMTRRYGGSGLGLSITKALVEKLGGSITVTSTLGMGSTFTVALPLSRGPNHRPVSAVAQLTRPSKQVLIVDDYAPNVMILKSIVEDLGYSFDVARNGQEAVKAGSETAYGLILMDVQMPGMDGLEATRRLRQVEAGKGYAPAIIVGVTAHVRVSDKHLCLEAGMDDFIPKPFEPGKVGDFLKKLVPQVEKAIASASGAPIIRFSEYLSQRA